METKNEHTHDGDKKAEKFLEVAISTTSGFYPETGYDRQPSHQKVEVQLQKAAKALKLADTAGWIASVNKTPIDTARSYEDNGLSGQVDIDWGPREGGGGNA